MPIKPPLQSFLRLFYADLRYQRMNATYAKDAHGRHGGPTVWGASREDPLVEDFQPRARQLTPSADWRSPVYRRRASSTAASAHPDRNRRRVRRHWDEPAVRDARVLFRFALGATDSRERPGRALADHLLATARHLGEVHRHRDAGRQSRRRRHPGVDRIAPTAHGKRIELASAGADGHLRRIAAVRRRDDHAGDHRAGSGRGTQGRHALVRAVRGADRGRDSDRGVRDSETWDAPGGQTVRPRHGGLVSS